MRTAEEEERRRFRDAPWVEIADLGYPYATSVHRLLRACMQVCSKTTDIGVVFVQADQICLQIDYSEDEQVFRVHAGWLSTRRATEELGLTNDLTEADVIFHTVKGLFSDILAQLTIRGQMDRSSTAEQPGRAEVSNIEQGLLAYLRMADLHVDAVSGSPGLRIRWKVDPNQSPRTVIEIQCHRVASCSHLRAKLLTADDGEFLSRYDT